jgi:hypothetical protein
VPVLWVRGDGDQVVSDESMFDFGTLGKLGIVPGWPGLEVYPPQPQLAQVRAVLTRYLDCGGATREVVVDGCGHGPSSSGPPSCAPCWPSTSVPRRPAAADRPCGVEPGRNDPVSRRRTVSIPVEPAQ